MYAIIATGGKQYNLICMLLLQPVVSSTKFPKAM